MELKKIGKFEVEVIEIAKMICHMNSEQQAELLNHIATITKIWRALNSSTDHEFAVAMQLQYLTDESVLSDDARKLMEMIGEYSYNDKNTNA